jgi:prepilin-type processing-associated H-X9-DG protein
LNTNATPSSPGTYGAGNGWAGQIYPYVKSAGVYTCPDDSTVPVAGDTVISYAVNYNFYAGDQASEVAGASSGYKANGITLSTFNAPAVTVELFEVQNVPDDNGNLGIQLIKPTGASQPYETHSPSGTAGCDNGGKPQSFANKASYATGIVSQATSLKLINSNTGVHTDASNYLAADGHVKWVRGTSVSGGYVQSSPTQQAGVENPFQGCGGASGTSILKNSGGFPVVLTFSPV